MEAQSFTCFPELPLELRRKVYAFASNDGREVDIHIAFKNNDDYIQGNHVSSSTRPPSILHVSNEVRVEALRYYRSIDLDHFGDMPTYDYQESHRRLKNNERKEGRIFYFNPATDRVHFVFSERAHFSFVCNAWHIFRGAGLRRMAINLADLSGESVRRVVVRMLADLVCFEHWADKGALEEVVLYFCSEGLWNKEERRELIEVTISNNPSSTVLQKMREVHGEIRVVRKIWDAMWGSAFSGKSRASKTLDVPQKHKNCPTIQFMELREVPREI